MNTTENVPIERLTTYRFLYYSLIQFLNKIDFNPKNINLFFDNLNNTALTNYRINDWFELIRQCLDDLYPRNKTDNKFTTESHGIMGSMVWLKPDIENKFVYDVINYSFPSCYPHIIVKLYKEGKISFNNDRIGDLFGDILNITLDDIKWWVNEAKPIIDTLIKIDNDFLSDSLWKFKRGIVNRFYGILGSSFDMKYKCNDISLVTKTMNEFWKEILEEFVDNICYIDTDEIYLKSDEFLNSILLEKYLGSLGIPFEKNTIRHNIKNSLFDTLMKSNMPENLQNQIINIDRNKKLERILDENFIKSNKDGTYVCIFMRKKRYMVFDENFDIVRVQGFSQFMSGTIKQKVK